MKKFTHSLGLLLLMLSFVVSANNSIGVVLGVVGKANIERGDQTVEVVRKIKLFENDTITSSENARVQLRFNDGTLTTMGANTSLKINAFTFQQKDEPNNAHFELLKGVFRTLTGELLKSSGAQFHVQTPVGTIGIRGTDFWGGYLEADNIDVLLISGEHAVELKNASGTAVLQKAGEGTTLKKNQAVPVVKTWPQIKVEKAIATIAWPGGDAPTQRESN